MRYVDDSFLLTTHEAIRPWELDIDSDCRGQTFCLETFAFMDESEIRWLELDKVTN